MESNATQLQCPGCGAPVSISDKTCSFCNGPILIRSFNSVADMPVGKVNKYADFYRKSIAADPANNDAQNALAMCYLKLKMYSKAQECFDKAIASNIDCSESYFYAAICLLAGKRPFLVPRPVIDKAEEYLNAAVMLEPKGVYYYLMAFIRHDFHFRKHFKVCPNWEEYLMEAESAGYGAVDADSLFALLDVAKPDGF